MKLTPEIYAKAFVETYTAEKLSAKEKEHLVEKFVSTVAKRNHTSWWSKIITAIEKQLAKKDEAAYILVETAHPIPNLKTHLKKILPDSDWIKEEIVPSLLGGFRLTVDGEKRLDYTLKKKLDVLTAHLTQL